MARPKKHSIVRRALKVEQDLEHPLYFFVVKASEILEIADISRVGRDSAGELSLIHI